jgi:hypothetical protein
MRIKNSCSFSDISTVKRDLNPASTQATLYRTGTLDVLTLTLGRLQAGRVWPNPHISDQTSPGYGYLLYDLPQSKTD